MGSHGNEKHLQFSTAYSNSTVKCSLWCALWIVPFLNPYSLHREFLEKCEFKWQCNETVKRCCILTIRTYMWLPDKYCIVFNLKLFWKWLRCYASVQKVWVALDTAQCQSFMKWKVCFVYIWTFLLDIPSKDKLIIVFFSVEFDYCMFEVLQGVKMLS